MKLATFINYVGDPVEALQLRRQLAAWEVDFNGWRTAAFRTLAAVTPESFHAELDVDGIVSADWTPPPGLAIPQMDLMTILGSAAELVDAPEQSKPTSTAVTPGGTRTCIAVELTDGRTWWVPTGNEAATPVLTVTAGGPAYVPADQLRVGLRVVVPVGEGTESVHARLLAASRRSSDVAALDLLLEQFRSAARHIINRPGRTYQQAVAVVSEAGAEHPSQLRAWADGTTIAPQVPADMAAVFAAAGRDAPKLNVLYAVANQLRGLSRTLGHFARAIAGGANQDAVAKLRELVGPAVDEVLDEFVVVTVASVSSASEVPSYLAGRVR